MSVRYFAAIMVATVLSAAVFGQTVTPGDDQGKNTNKKEIRSTGCTRHGVESGCMVLEGYKDNKVYDLFFPTGKKPAFDTAIAFEGTIHEGPTTCQQGSAVDVTKWTPVRMKCPKPKAANTE